MNRKGLLFWGVIVILFGVFYLPPIENRTEAEDAYMYARDVEQLSYRQLLHPNHRLYHPLAKAVFLASGAERSFDVLVLFSGLLAGAALIAFYLLVKRVTSCDRWQSLAWTACLAFSYGYWRYAREVEAYAMGWLGCLLALWVLFVVKGSWRKGLFFAVTVVLVLNIHRALGPPLLVVGVVYFLRQKQWRVAGGSVGLGLVFYLVCEAGFGRLTSGQQVIVDSDKISQFFSEDLRSDTQLKRKGRSLSLSSLPKGGVGLGVGLMGGNVLMASDEVFDFFEETLFPYRFMEEERMMAEGVSRFWIVIWIAGVLTVVFVLGREVEGMRRSGWKVLKDAGPEAWAATSGFVSFAGMIVIFEPGNPEMWLLGLPLFWLTIALFLRRTSGSRVWTLSVSLMLTSYVGGMALLSNKGRDYHHVTSSLVREEARESDLYLMGTPNAVHVRYVSYAVNLEIAAVRIGDERERGFYRLVREQIEAGRRVFVHDTLQNFDSHFEGLIGEAGLRVEPSIKAKARTGGWEILLQDESF